jgi:hypothetical protein
MFGDGELPRPAPIGAFSYPRERHPVRRQRTESLNIVASGGRLPLLRFCLTDPLSVFCEVARTRRHPPLTACQPPRRNHPA